MLFSLKNIKSGLYTSFSLILIRILTLSKGKREKLYLDRGSWKILDLS